MRFLTRLFPRPPADAPPRPLKHALSVKTWWVDINQRSPVLVCQHCGNFWVAGSPDEADAYSTCPALTHRHSEAGRLPLPAEAPVNHPTHLPIPHG